MHHAALYTIYGPEPDHPLGEPFDCTYQEGFSKGVPLLTIDRGYLSSPDEMTYQDVDAALPIGKGYGSFWLLEVHYNNLAQESGVVDSTGIQVRR